MTGLRIGEAIGIKWSDFDDDVLKIQRRIYEGTADETKTEIDYAMLVKIYGASNDSPESRRSIWSPERTGKKVRAT